MKKIILGMFVGVVLMSALSFKVIHEVKKSTAEANSYEGILVFADAEPVTPYEVIGEVRLAIYSHNDDCYKDAIVALLEHCKKTYPTGEGLILDVNKFRYTAKVITFKK